MGLSHWCLVDSTTVSLNIEPGPEVIKLFSCSTQLSMKIFLLINVKMPTIVGILTFMSRKNSILGLSESLKKSLISRYFYTYEHLKFHAQLSWAWKKIFITSGPCHVAQSIACLTQELELLGLIPSPLTSATYFHFFGNKAKTTNNNIKDWMCPFIVLGVSGYLSSALLWKLL